MYIRADGDAEILHRGPAPDDPGKRGAGYGQGKKEQACAAEGRRDREEDRVLEAGAELSNATAQPGESLTFVDILECETGATWAL